MNRHDAESRSIRDLGLRPANDADAHGGGRDAEAYDRAFQQARQEHAALVRVYEAFDQNHDAYREQLLAALPAKPAPLTSAPRRRRRVGEWVMTFLLNRKTAAILTPAACLIAVAALFWATSGQVALASVIRKLNSFQTLVCRVQTEISGGSTPAGGGGQMYLSVQHGMRFDMLNNGELFTSIYSAPSGQKVVCVTPSMKTYMTITRAEARPDSPAAFGEWLRSLQRLTGDADRRLGRELIDGRPAEGFEISGEKLHRDAAGIAQAGPVMREAVAKLWVDVDTLLPLRFEVGAPGPERGSTMSVIHDRFEWDRTLDEAFFKPAIGEDYAALDLNLPPVNEQALIAGLRKFAELAGEYPRVLEPAYVSSQVAVLIAKARAGGGDDVNSLMKSAAQECMTVSSACGYFQQLDREGRKPEYFGETVKPGDAGAVLMTWAADGGTRVIYGDLRVETRPG